MSAEDIPSNDNVVEKGLAWPDIDLQPVKVVSTFYLCTVYLYIIYLKYFHTLYQFYNL